MTQVTVPGASPAAAAGIAQAPDRRPPQVAAVQAAALAALPRGTEPQPMSRFEVTVWGGVMNGMLGAIAGGAAGILTLIVATALVAAGVLSGPIGWLGLLTFALMGLGLLIGTTVGALHAFRTYKPEAQAPEAPPEPPHDRGAGTGSPHPAKGAARGPIVTAASSIHNPEAQAIKAPPAPWAIKDPPAPWADGRSESDLPSAQGAGNGAPPQAEATDPPTAERGGGGLTPLSISKNFQNRPGRHTIKSPVAGSRAEELLAVKKAMKSERVLASLQEAIYIGKFIYLIPTTKKDEADKIARELFLNYISKYTSHGCTEQNIVDWDCTGMPGFGSNKTFIYDLENEHNTWCVHAVIEARHGSYNERYNGYLPPHVVAYHELMHVEEIPLKASDKWGGEMETNC